VLLCLSLSCAIEIVTLVQWETISVNKLVIGAPALGDESEIGFGTRSGEAMAHWSR